MARTIEVTIPAPSRRERISKRMARVMYALRLKRRMTTAEWYAAGCP